MMKITYFISFAQKIMTLMIFIILCLTMSFSYYQPAFANIRQQEESPEQLLYQARHRLQDNQGQTWQLILFKRIKNGQVKDVDLRLVGFPNQVNFIHPQNLILQTQKGVEFIAPDQFREKAPAENVGEYNLQEILLDLTQEKSLKLKLPVKENLSLNIPYPILLEWEQIANY